MKHATDVRPFAGLDVTVPDEVRSRIDLVLGLRHHWANTIFAALRSQYEAKVKELPLKPRTGSANQLVVPVPATVTDIPYCGIEPTEILPRQVW